MCGVKGYRTRYERRGRHRIMRSCSQTAGSFVFRACLAASPPRFSVTSYPVITNLPPTANAECRPPTTSSSPLSHPSRHAITYRIEPLHTVHVVQSRRPHSAPIYSCLQKRGWNQDISSCVNVSTIQPQPAGAPAPANTSVYDDGQGQRQRQPCWCK